MEVGKVGTNPPSSPKDQLKDLSPTNNFGLLENGSGPELDNGEPYIRKGRKPKGIGRTNLTQNTITHTKYEMTQTDMKHYAKEE